MYVYRKILAGRMRSDIHSNDDDWWFSCSFIAKLPVPSSIEQDYWFIKKARDDSTDYLIRGIAKRRWRNKQSAPTPYRISIPLAGERICDKHERLLTAYPSSVKFGDFRIKDKAKTLFKYVWWGHGVSHRMQIYKKLWFNNLTLRHDRQNDRI